MATINIHDELLVRIDQSELWLLTHIVKRLNKEMFCFPSNKTLMSDTGWGIDKLQKVKKSLQDKGFLHVELRFNAERQTSNVYYLTTNLIGTYIGGDKLSGWVKVYPPEKPHPNTEKTSTDSIPEKPITEVLTINEVLTPEETSGSQKALFQVTPEKEKSKAENKKKKVQPMNVLRNSRRHGPILIPNSGLMAFPVRRLTL